MFLRTVVRRSAGVEGVSKSSSAEMNSKLEKHQDLREVKIPMIQTILNGCKSFTLKCVSTTVLW